ncbi:MAG TPA: cytochrome c [Bacteroidia bacterium]|nr:cytochrome c [Bacteroidia bacterium]
MKFKLGFLTFLIPVFCLYSTSQVFSASPGSELFKTNCMACHTIGKGKVVGPDLKGVNERYEEAWLLKWIKSSQSLVKSGDTVAVSLFEANNKVVMTDFPSLADEQIKSILTYIKEEGLLAAATAAATGSSFAGGQTTGEPLFSFSFSETILLSLVIMLLLVVLSLSISVRKLSNELSDYYSGNRSEF